MRSTSKTVITLKDWLRLGNMADITMCNNDKCPLRQKCFRYMATPSPYWQPYYCMDEEEPVEDCMYFWEFKDSDELDKLNRMWK